jgi:hypothetical protein
MRCIDGSPVWAKRRCQSDLKHNRAEVHLVAERTQIALGDGTFDAKRLP